MKEKLSDRDYSVNFWAFVWHATFLALTKSFIDTDTVLPALILRAGGNDFLIGLMSVIMIGSAKFMQLFFAPYISSHKNKKLQLLLAINIRILALIGLVLLIFIFENLPQILFFVALFVVLIVFSWSGSYGGVAYTDLLGKSIKIKQRMTLFSLKQMFQAVGFVLSAFMVKYILKRFDFPLNYAYSFAIAAVLLTIGSLGFWLLKEKYVKPQKRKSILEFFKLIPEELKTNVNLKFFIITVNILGIFMAFTPFLISFFKQHIELDAQLIGNLLIIKMVGVVLGSLVVYIFKHRIKYKFLLFGTAIATILIPLIAILIEGNLLFIKLIFFVIGVAFSFQRIAIEGILIEISNEQNRSEYAGIVGAANLSGIIFPFLLGTLLSFMSPQIVFLMVSLTGAISVFFIAKLNCAKSV